MKKHVSKAAIQLTQDPFGAARRVGNDEGDSIDARQSLKPTHVATFEPSPLRNRNRSHRACRIYTGKEGIPRKIYRIGNP